MAAVSRRINPAMLAAVALLALASVISFVPWRVYSMKHGRLALWIETRYDRLTVAEGIAGPGGTWSSFEELDYPDGSWGNSFFASSTGSDYIGVSTSVTYPARTVFSLPHFGFWLGSRINKATGFWFVQLPPWPLWLLAAVFLHRGWHREIPSRGFEIVKGRKGDITD